MKRKGLVVLALLIVASLMAAMGTGALDVFSANRSSAMHIVNDSTAIISLTGDKLYAFEQNDGTLKLDFTKANNRFLGEGFNTKAELEFHDVFTVTNQSAKVVYVWLESEDWDWEHNNGLTYNIGRTNGTITGDTSANTDHHNRLLWSSSNFNFVKGKGKAAYVRLDPGELFTVDILVNTGGASIEPHRYDWTHKVTVKANENEPSRLL